MNDRSYLPVEVGPSPADLPAAGAIIPFVQNRANTEQRAQPMSSLLASAMRLTGNREGGARPRPVSNGAAAEKGWQKDAWEMYRLVGEVRFLVNVLAAQGAKAKFYVGKFADDPTDDPIPVEDAELQGLLDAIGDGPSGLQQIIKRLLLNLQVAADGYLVGIPEWLIPESKVERPPEGTELVMDDLVWRMMSVQEVSRTDDDEYSLRLSAEDTVRANPNDLYLIRVWNPDPAEMWEADSPVRSSLPVLRELVGLTMHIAAQIDSRLAGAGVLLASQSAAEAARVRANLPEDSEEDPFTDSLIEGMMTPIRDRSNASAYVPLVWVVPDHTVANGFKHLDFGKKLDAQAESMRTESIRRFALGADAPPELLLGVGGMNHWGSWLVKEDTVRTHQEPNLALVADALTTQYLRPLMLAMNRWSAEEIEEYVVWFDVSDLIVEPSRKDDAKSLFDAGVIGARALRDAYGFSEEDAPGGKALTDAQAIALDMVRKNPALMANPGLAVIVEQIEGLLSGNPQPLPEGVTVDEPQADSPQAVDGAVEGEVQGPPQEVTPPALAAAAITVRQVERDLGTRMLSRPGLEPEDA